MAEFDKQRIEALTVPTGRLGIGLIAALLLVFSAAADTPPTGVNDDEWASIQSQIEAEHLKVTTSDRPGAIYRADSPSQRFTAHFGAEALTIAPRDRGAPAWQLDLQLTAWGAAHDLKQINFASVSADANRVEYRRGALTEWYVNTPMGLEQGFTIEAPPDDDITELVLEMTVGGDLTAELAESGQTVNFRLGDSSTHLTYSGLKAWDAVEAPLEARMELVGGGTRLRIVVEVAGAAWPVVVDPTFVTVAKIPSPLYPDPSYGNLGVDIAIDGDWMVVGRLGDYSAGPVAAQIYHRGGGDPNNWEHVVEIKPDDSPGGSTVRVDISGDTVILGVPVAGTSGRAYAFQRDHGGPNAWGQIAFIEPGDDLDSRFGISIAMSRDTAVIGAYRADNNDGAAYVFGRDHGGPNTWGQIVRIANPDPGSENSFGVSAALDGETAVIGTDGGSAHVYYRNQGGADVWGFVSTLVPADGFTDSFGAPVALSGDTALVGQPVYVFRRDQGGPNAWGQSGEITTDDGLSIGSPVAIDGTTVAVGANSDDGNGLNSGSAYVFERDHGGSEFWGQVAKITASNAMEQARFGWSVAIQGDTLAVGAPDHYSGEDGRGEVYVFGRDQGGAYAWGEIQILPRPPFLTAWYNHFGTSVDMDGDTAVIGGPNNQGWAHIFRQTPGEPGVWERVTRVTADDDESPWGDEFGFSAAISGDTVIVGAYGDNDYSLTDPVWDTGSAYIFQQDHGGNDNWGLVTRVYAQTFGLHTNGEFGYSVAIDGDTAVVGGEGSYWGYPPAHVFQRNHGGPDAWGHVTGLSPSDANWQTYIYYLRRVAISDDTAVVGWFNNGSVYIFERNHGGPDTWGESAAINVDRWIDDIAVNNDTIIVGSHASTVHGHEPGAAFIYQRDQGGPGSWGQVAMITPHDSADDDTFGYSVAIDGDIAVVGSLNSNIPGAVYAFRRDFGGPEAWGEIAKFSDDDDYVHFGKSVSVSGDTTIVGAPEDSTVGLLAGAVYLFSISDAFFADGFELGDTSGWSATVP